MDEPQHLAGLFFQKVGIEGGGLHQGDATLQSDALGMEVGQFRRQFLLLLVVLVLRLNAVVTAEGMKAEITDGARRSEKERKLAEKSTEAGTDDHASENSGGWLILC